MLDIATAYNKYKFIGSEFLLWLWWASENEEESQSFYEEFGTKDHGLSVAIGPGMIIENNTDNKSKIAIKGDLDKSYKEAMIALNKGGNITEMNFVFVIANDYSFAIKADDLSIKGLRISDIQTENNKDEIEGAVLEKITLNEIFFECLDKIFISFVINRISDDWDSIVLKINQWLIGEE